MLKQIFGIDKMGAARYYTCSWCGVRIDKVEGELSDYELPEPADWRIYSIQDLVRAHQFGRCPGRQESKNRYKSSLLDQIESYAAEIGQHASIANGEPKRKLIALRRKAKLAGVSIRDIGNATSKGWGKHSGLVC